MRVALISLEPWDAVWRRNQHLAVRLVADGHVEHVLFVEPPLLGRAPRSVMRVAGGVDVVRPFLPAPKRVGGLIVTGRLMRSTVLRQADVLWVNDATLGVHCLAPSQPAVHDVTDDWRELHTMPRIRRRTVRAEDVLASAAHTVVCSEVLQERWQRRYGVHADVVHNGVDVHAWESAPPQPLTGDGPHVGYVGTLHEGRLDVDLLLDIADSSDIGTVHLVGPVALAPRVLDRLQGHPKIRLHGPVPSDDVPSWSVAMDALVSPHVVTEFTLSLDAIKSYEYLASGCPVVATPTSGFQRLQAPQLAVADRAVFVPAVVRALRTDRPRAQPPAGIDWSDRAAEFAGVLDRVHRAVA